MNRRSFLKSGAAGLALSSANGYASRFADRPPLRVAVIGSGWYGKSDIFRLVQIAPVEIVALCDVDQTHLDIAAEWSVERQASKNKPKLYTDYRKLLAEEELDMVEIATPDHWHALPMIEACRAGVDIYVQKPISVDVVEGQAMVAAARKYGRVVQVGTQRRSTPHLIEARDIVQQGKLGTIGHVDVFSYGGGRPLIAKPGPVPDTLDWEMWVGPAPMMEYSPEVQRRWRSFMEYGNGTIGDMGIHMFDMVRWFMDLGWPKRISSFGGLRVQKGGANNVADEQTAIFEYENLNVVWQHRRFGAPPDPNYNWGAYLYGDKGTLRAGVLSYDFTPTGKNASTLHRDFKSELDEYPVDRNEHRLEKHVAPAIRGHMQDLLDNIETRGRPVADIAQGHTSSACCILSNISMQLGRTLTWDAESGLVEGDEEANRLLRRPYRRPWIHPEVINV